MVASTTRPTKNSKAVREYKASGNKAMQNGLYQKAVRMYTKALEIDAGNAILYSNRSSAHFNIRQFSESLEDAESSILCDHLWWKAYKRKGLALIHMQRYEEAIASLEEGLTIVGKNAEMEKNLEFAKACQEQAQNLYILPEQHMMQRLESVPVFIVTDHAGQPFFVTYDDGQQVCTFYFDKNDAMATLDWIKNENKELGESARVIHITLHQAFNLAQETQKQYYEETTRAAAEEDRKAALEAEKKTKELKRLAKISKNNDDINDDKIEQEENITQVSSTTTESTTPTATTTETQNEGETENKPRASTDDWEEAEVDETEDDEDDDDEDDVEESKEASSSTATETKLEDKKDKGEGAGEGEEEKKTVGEDKNEDDAIIDENAPLSFQFRPELRQVQVAVELLNKNPNPPVRPILRDPPSIRKARAEAKAKVDDKTDTPDEAIEKAESDDKISEEKEEKVEVTNVEEKKEENVVDKATEKVDVSIAESSEPKTETEDKKESAEDKEGEEAETIDITKDKEAKSSTESSTKAEEEKEDKSTMEEGETEAENDEDVELTVDNFNGIPIFQAKGLTLLQKSKQLIPLFFSKWDLEDAWLQLKNTNAIDIPGECEIEVGTLEDVLRRMSESKTDEFESVFFVPSRESMRAINVKFPLDDLSPPLPPSGTKQNTLTSATANTTNAKRNNRNGFPISRAKQIAARGGTKEEIRAAIVEDLRKYEERQKMAEVVSQIEHARRLSGVGGVGSVGFSSTMAAATSAASGSAPVTEGENKTDSSPANVEKTCVVNNDEGCCSNGKCEKTTVEPVS